MKKFVCLASLCLVALSAMVTSAAAEELFTRKQDVIYGRKYGTALTMDVFTPTKNANGAAAIVAISGGWVSDHDLIQPLFVLELLKHGYTCFCVVHGSQPKFTIPECISDMNRSVRYIRSHAADYNIDPNRIGVTGASAGGHLSLMLGCAEDSADPKAKDSVDRASSRVQAVACFFPPTDFLNYGTMGTKALGLEELHKFKPPFDFHTQDPVTKVFVPVDLATREKIVKEISPIYHVTKDDAPTLIIHGDSDKLVPIQQAELIMARFKDAGVPAELIVKKGADHGWPTILSDFKSVADWFDKYLKSSATAQAAN